MRNIDGFKMAFSAIETINDATQIKKLNQAKKYISDYLESKQGQDLTEAEVHYFAMLYAANETLFPTSAIDFTGSIGKALTSIKVAAKTVKYTPDELPKFVCANGACFVAGTLIQTVDGLKPIEQIQRGNLVWSRQEFGDAYAYKPVFETKVTENQQIYEVVVENTSGETETYLTTAEHPFYIADLGWLKASLLEAGMPLLDSNGNSGSLKVKSQTKLERWETVYNFEVEDYVTYHIGEFGVWVHNQCCEVALATLESFVETGRRGTGKLHRIDEDGLKQLIETIGYNKEGLTKAKAILEHSLSVRRAEKAKFPNGLDKGHRDRINMEQKMLDKINRMIQQSE